MNVIEQISGLLFPLLVGLGLGGFYFLGLWWTVRRISTTRPIGRWMVASFILRTAVVVTGFYWVMDGQWQRLLVCLAGFIMVRLLLTAMLRSVGGRVFLPPE